MIFIYNSGQEEYRLVLGKRIDEFFVKHKKKLQTIGIYVLIILLIGCLAAAFNEAFSDESRAENRAETMQKEIDAGLTPAKLFADNADMVLPPTTSASRTLIYTVDDPECGFTLYLLSSGAGFGERPSISGERTSKKIAVSPTEGFKQISGSIATNLEQAPEVFRCVNLSRNKVIYYLDWYGASCSFDLFENIT